MILGIGRSIKVVFLILLTLCQFLYLNFTIVRMHAFRLVVDILNISYELFKELFSLNFVFPKLSYLSNLCVLTFCLWSNGKSVCCGKHIVKCKNSFR